MIKIDKIYNTDNLKVKTNFSKSILIKFRYNNMPYIKWIDCGDHYPIIKSFLQNKSDKANMIISKELIIKVIIDNMKHNEKILGQI